MAFLNALEVYSYLSLISFSLRARVKSLFYFSFERVFLVLLSVFDKNTNFWTKMRLFWNQKLIFSPVFRNFSSSRFLFQFVTPYIFSTFTGKLTGVDKFLSIPLDGFRAASTFHFQIFSLLTIFQSLHPNLGSRGRGKTAQK